VGDELIDGDTGIDRRTWRSYCGSSLFTRTPM